MQITTACLVIRTPREPLEYGQRFHCTALADPSFTASSIVLSNAIGALTTYIRRYFEQHEETGFNRGEFAINPWVFDPVWKTKTVSLLLSLPDRTVKTRLPFVVRPFGVRLLAQSPITPGLNILIDSPADLDSEASRLLPVWIKNHEHWQQTDWNHLLLPTDHWIEHFEVDFDLKKFGKMSTRNFMKYFFKQQKLSNSRQLSSIGRCLDHEDLGEPPLQGTTDRIDRIEALMNSSKRHSVALIGNPGVGKTSIIHEIVRRRLKSRSGKKSGQSTKKLVWSVNSLRIVSGMKYVGQWEERWIGILREVRRKGHILVIENPLGLLNAGVTRDSDLNAADVLLGFVATHPIRMITEMTPQEYGVLKVRKRALADSFLAFQVDAMTREESLDLLIDRTGELEVQHRKFMHPGTIPLIISNSDRYFRGESYPGKVVKIAEDLCRSNTPGINGKDLIGCLQRRTGLELSRKVLEPRELQRELRSHVIGQDAAVERVYQFMMRANSGLPPDDRPLGVFLCLGPTGVGKTELAKAVSRVMFENEHHFLRFDMNEINSSVAAEQLIGSFQQPDGKLTSAVRRQPFSVILFDEIEKAHPDVFDYLLQVIGEGRLTDAVGRTIDFRDTFILMTSNLGAKEVSKSVGFEFNNKKASDHYRRVARAFFRPEFINRLDDILVFHYLSRRHIEQIAHMQLANMAQREGIQRRNIYLRLEKDAIDWLVDRGYDPQLGARVLKRELERYMAQPLADSMAESPILNNCLLHIQHHQGQLNTNLIPLIDRPRKQLLLPSIEVTLAESRTQTDHLDSICLSIKDSCDFSKKLSPDVINYYALREQIRLCRELHKYLNSKWTSKRITQDPYNPPRIRQVRRNFEHRGQTGYVDATDEIRDAFENDEKGFETLSAESIQWSLCAELEFSKAMFDAIGKEESILLYIRRITSKMLNESEAWEFYNAIYRLVIDTASEGLGLDFELSTLLTSFASEKELRDSDNRGKLIEFQRALAQAQGVGVILRGLGAKVCAQTLEGLWTLKREKHLFRIGVVVLDQVSGTNEDNCEKELQKVLQNPDALYCNSESLQPGSLPHGSSPRYLTAIRDFSMIASGTLSYKPKISSKLDCDNTQFNNLGRRMLLDWLLLERLGSEVDQ